MIVIGVISVICLQIIVSEVGPLSAMLKTISLPPLEMLILFGIALISMFAVEIYKFIDRKISKK